MMNTPTENQDRAGNWAARGVIAAGRGIALAGLTLAATGLWAALLAEVAFAPLGAGLLPMPGTLRAMRRLANTVRRRSGEWCGLAISVPSVPGPARPDDRKPGQRPGLWRQLGVLLADQATWRDLLWTAVDITAGWVFTLAPAGLIVWGLFGAVMPAVWHPIAAAHANNWYAFIHVTDPRTAWLSVPLGLAFGALGLWAGPRLLRCYGTLARSMLAPARQTELALRTPA
jgi:hypothetical protein